LKSKTEGTNDNEELAATEKFVIIKRRDEPDGSESYSESEDDNESFEIKDLADNDTFQELQPDILHSDLKNILTLLTL
jgi:hypothetical protein